ncbi:MAG TPA: hypothetical protein VMT46_14575 [Anaerolineaceae bacterium]|nr:hypothetical protein [Anaerolineaceae bacterium]
MIGSKPPTQPYKFILPISAVMVLFCLYGAGSDFLWLENNAQNINLVYAVLLAAIIFLGVSGWILTHSSPSSSAAARVFDRLSWVLTFAALFAQFTFPVGSEYYRLVSMVVFLMIAGRGLVIFANYWRRYQEDRQGQ